jgi:hypothetical protein
MAILSFITIADRVSILTFVIADISFGYSAMNVTRF